ncbi:MULTISPECIES: histone-like nucleoid-structuring protein Lsr2 [Kocuria]|uniref:Lsr2 family protein n=2 Tax=Kocuria marina TaxID=223184 RepID=A0A0B0DJZ0_9MICC|nr:MULTISPECIES: Lsr2 family protein [Kocuria]MBX7556251.1 Lsr2 family protein [Streptomyces sp. tea 10]KHE75554.1 hypothetical protein AS25_00250 [Kocuria marina]MBN6812647.1 Lsr2 family protein [Kocuria indica]MBN6844335.1 Lsr2 family protein [Kocuria indica]MCG7431855.1 Lsr2 family protein [Kocuria indica]
MAQTVKIILEDDIDGGEANETVRFGLDGGQYEIDLSSANATKLRDALRPYVAAGRRASAKSGRSQNTTTRPNRSGNPETPKIRAWAKKQGLQVSDRGRIHQDIQDKYYAAHND